MDDQKQREKQYQREHMAEVRSYRRTPEPLENKKKRHSENSELRKRVISDINAINHAAETIIKSIAELQKNESAWSLGFDNTADLFRERVNLPSSVATKMGQLAKWKQKVSPNLYLKDLMVLDLFQQLNDEDLMDTTLRILEEKGVEPELDNVIRTVKRIYVEGLKNFHIKPEVLDRFIKNRYVAPTRPNIDIVLGRSDINTEFEHKLRDEQESLRNEEEVGLVPKRRNKKKRLNK